MRCSRLAATIRRELRAARLAANRGVFELAAVLPFWSGWTQGLAATWTRLLGPVLGHAATLALDCRTHHVRSILRVLGLLPLTVRGCNASRV